MPVNEPDNASCDPQLSGLLLAGGKSRRLGREKGLIPFRGRPLATWALGALDAISDDVWISANREDLYRRFDRPIVLDIHPGRGPLAGLFAAFNVVRHDLLAVAACDMPFASPALYRHLARLSPGYDVVIPTRQAGSYREPLHAVYHRRCQTAIEEALARGERRVVAIFGALRVREVPEAEWRDLPGLDTRVFENVNTREDLDLLGGPERAPGSDGHPSPEG